MARPGLNNDLAKEKDLLDKAKNYRIAASDFLLDVDELKESTLEPVEGAAKYVVVAKCRAGQGRAGQCSAVQWCGDLPSIMPSCPSFAH
jgi:hypothetical protein